MRERARLAMIARLIEVQRARRVGAEAALAEARVAEAGARDAEDAAKQALEGAHQDWLACVAQTGFSPEYSRALSDALIARDSDSYAAGLRTDAAARHTVRRQEDWQLLEAQVRAGAGVHRKLRRKAARRADEKRLDALADQITWKWRRP